MSISPKCARCGKARDKHRDGHCPLPGVRNLWSKKDTWKPKPGLRKVSKKMTPRLKLYSALRKEFLEAHPFCEFENVTGGRCSFHSAEVHHMQNRGPNLNRTETWMACCKRHHRLIHEQPNEARKRGYLK